MSTIPNFPALKQRLHQLSIQQARYGISADPSIITEVQALDTVVQQMGLIETHRHNLEHMLNQRSHFGANVPPHIVTQIASERQQIERLRAVCAKYGHPVAAHPLDSDAGASTAPEAPVALPDDPLAIIREKLEDLEVMLRRGHYDDARAIVRELRALIK